MKLTKNEDQSLDTLPLLRNGNKTPMEGVTETKFGAVMKGRTIQRLPYPVIHPIADCEHLFLCLLGPCIVSKETDISGSFQKIFTSVCNGVSVWRLIMGWIPGYGSL